MADEPVKFSVNSNIMRIAIAGSMARSALGKILKDGRGRLSVYYDDAGALHVVGDHGAPSASRELGEQTKVAEDVMAEDQDALRLLANG
jgi:hypothetical protein